LLNMHLKRVIALFSALVIMTLPALADTHTREDVRAAYSALDIDTDLDPYAERPVISGDYAPGRLSDAAQNDAVEYLNFIRYLAYLDGSVALDPLYGMRAQHGAVLLAANDELAHDAPRAAGMADGFYQTALTGTMSSNIAAINWMDGDILLVSVEYFVRDDGDFNLDTLGHRRWLLDPRLGKTGFGLANSETGVSYTAMYVHDDSADARGWKSVKWPSEGAFPADLTSFDIPWSITLNPAVYADDFSNVTVDMYEKSAGRAELKCFLVSTDNYGAGPCIIFMPDLGKMGLADYQQNQVWYVRVDGLRTIDGGSASMEYSVEMMSLYPIDPSAVEVEPRSLQLSAGDTAQLTAQVIPEWADDLNVSWSTTDPSVATVDECGTVTAVSEGECGIVAVSVNGRSDECRITVK